MGSFALLFLCKSASCSDISFCGFLSLMGWCWGVLVGWLDMDAFGFAFVVFDGWGREGCLGKVARENSVLEIVCE